MPHDTPLITTIVAALVLAYVFGAIANRLKMPPIVGYIIAGVAVGPHSPGFVADQTLASQLADLGVVLLMFGVGLNFSLSELLSVKAVAVPGALIRLVVATGMGIALGMAMGWPLMGGLVFGLALAVSSTVVTLKVLQDRHLVDSDRGRVAVGWLVVEDLAMVLALVLIPAFAGSQNPGAAADGAQTMAAESDAFVALAEQLLHTHLVLWQVIAITIFKLLAFVGFMVVVGRRIIPFVLHTTAHTGSRELFRLAVLAIALGVAAGAAYLFGVSLALGAFFAGMILSESQLSQRAAQETLPLRDAFGVLFFVSVGMLFDPSIIVEDPLPVLGTLAIVIFGKSIVAFLLTLVFRRSVPAALTVSASLAQIGEFSFILAALGISLGVMPEEGRGLILAGAIISIILNPLIFWVSERIRPRLEARVATRRAEPELGPVVPDQPSAVAAPAPVEPEAVLEEVQLPTTLHDHVVLIGYGRVGSVVASELVRDNMRFLVIEDAEGRVVAARDAGLEVIVGNAATRETLNLANVAGARCAIIAIPNAFEAGQATEQCRKLNPGLKIIARAHADEEVAYLERLGADQVIMGEREIGLGMVAWLTGESRHEAPAAAAPTEEAAGETATEPVIVPEVVTPASATPVVPPAEPRLPDAPSVLATPAPAVEESGKALPRTVPSSEIVILPPEAPATRELRGGNGGDETADLPFRSAFWSEEAPEADGGEPELFPAGSAPRVAAVSEPPADVAPRGNLAGDNLLATLDRDLFGEGPSEPAPQPAEPPSTPDDPVPVPQPIETPQPNEDPVPAPQPIETPRPNEDPVPVPQPIETPVPQEIPAAPPVGVPTSPTRAAEE